MELVWARKKPKLPGWYWYRDFSDSIVWVYDKPDGELATHIYDRFELVSGLKGKWAGPIPKPQEPKP